MAGRELKAAIALSSSDFFQLIEPLQAEDLDALSPEIKQTIRKYFNRACFRATPYGNFAAIGVATFSAEVGPALVIADTPVLHTLPDWTCSKEVVVNPEEVMARSGLLFTNHSYYLLGGKIRFLSLQEGGVPIS
ncbi:lantibiotic dehydratase [Mucilaginibacter sp. UC70_90]